jgi:hypothetical protein
MARPSVDIEDLVMALDDHTGAEYYLDIETGEVLRFSADPGLNEDLEEEFGEAMENNSERFRLIEPIPSSKSFQVMADFVESLPDSKAKFNLSRALERSRPFRNFKDTLLSFPDIREQWFQYHHEIYREFAISWLQGEEIEADLRSIKSENEA